MFRKHALYFMEAKEQIQQLTSSITNSQQTGGLLFPTTTFIHTQSEDEDLDTDEEEDLTNIIRRLVRPTTPTIKEDTEVQTEETSNNSRNADQKEEEDCIPEPDPSPQFAAVTQGTGSNPDEE